MVTSKNTSINSAKLPKLYTSKAARSIYEGKRVIDLGCGKFDNAKAFAESLGCKVGMYDPWNRPAEENAAALSASYDVAVISNVLNVIQKPEDRRDLLQLASSKAPVILVTVYEGDQTGKGRITKADCWQENRRTESYVEEIAKCLPEYRVTRKGNLIVGRR